MQTWISSICRHLSVGLDKSFLPFLFLNDDEPLSAQCAGRPGHQSHAGLSLLRWAESAGRAPNVLVPLQVQMLKPYPRYSLEVALGARLRAEEPARRGRGTRMYLQGDAGTPSADVIRAVLPWGWGARDPGLVTVFTIVFSGGRYMTRKLLSCLTLKCKIPLRKEPFNPYDCNVPMGGIWSGCWACLLKTDCLYLFCSAIQIILQYVYSMTKIN